MRLGPHITDFWVRHSPFYLRGLGNALWDIIFLSCTPSEENY